MDHRTGGFGALRMVLACWAVFANGSADGALLGVACGAGFRYASLVWVSLDVVIDVPRR